MGQKKLILQIWYCVSILIGDDPLILSKNVND